LAKLATKVMLFTWLTCLNQEFSHGAQTAHRALLDSNSKAARLSQHWHQTRYLAALDTIGKHL